MLHACWLLQASCYSHPSYITIPTQLGHPFPRDRTRALRVVISLDFHENWSRHRSQLSGKRNTADLRDQSSCESLMELQTWRKRHLILCQLATCVRLPSRSDLLMRALWGFRSVHCPAVECHDSFYEDSVRVSGWMNCAGVIPNLLVY